MNRRQRRGMVMLVLTAIGAIAVFLFVLQYVSDVNAQVGDKVSVLELTKDVGAYQPIDESAYRVIEVPARWTTDATFQSATDTDPGSEVAGLVAASALPKGSVLQKGMVIPKPGGQAGYREIAIVVDAETGVAGKVSPGDHVDILATTAGSEYERACAAVVVENALVLDVGVVTEAGGNGGDFTNNSGVPVTFSLTSEEALLLTNAESFSVKLRLSLRAADDDRAIPNDQKKVCEGD